MTSSMTRYTLNTYNRTTVLQIIALIRLLLRILWVGNAKTNKKLTFCDHDDYTILYDEKRKSSYSKAWNLDKIRGLWYIQIESSFYIMLVRTESQWTVQNKVFQYRRQCGRNRISGENAHTRHCRRSLA